jgi:oxygen-dependent protoporphyrinogen oxidase
LRDTVTRVAVVGGGIAGLSAAWTLQERGVEVTLLEAGQRLGGKIRTERRDGLLIDAGPDSFLSTKPAALQLIERLGLSNSVVSTLPDGGGTFILRNGGLLPLPEGITLLVPAELRSIARTPLLSALGKARMAMDYVIPARRDPADESIGAFVRRRVGRQAFERMAEPLLSGIYAGDADRLSLLSTFPRLREMEQLYGSLVKAAIAQKRQAGQRPAAGGPRRTPFVSLSGGLGQLIDALEAQLERAQVLTGASVERLERSNGSYRLTTNAGARIDTDGVVLAAPAYAAAALLQPLDAELARSLAGIEYVSTATVSLAFDAREIAQQQGGRGFVIPRTEGRTLTAVTWTSNKFGGRAPDGVALLRGFVGRAGDEAPLALPDDQLVTVVRRELREILGITAAPSGAWVFRWPRALPQYNLGHQERLAGIAERLREHPRLALTGAAYRGIGIPDCVSDATAQASALVGRMTSAG